MIHIVSFRQLVRGVALRWIGAVIIDVQQANRFAVRFYSEGKDGVAIERRFY